MSLSPRPERFTTSISRGAIAGAMRIASATACALSSAGKMPSVRASFTTASRARGVVAGDVFGAAGVVQHGVLGPDGRIVETRRDGMRERDLAVFILQHIGVGALQHSRRAALEPRRVLAQRRAAAAGLDADEPHFAVAE